MDSKYIYVIIRIVERLLMNKREREISHVKQYFLLEFALRWTHIEDINHRR